MSDILAVDIPTPSIPDVDASKGTNFFESVGQWFVNLSPDGWKLLVAGVGAAIILWLFRRSPMLKGVAIGVVLLAIAFAIWS